MLIGYLYGVTSERKLIEELRMHRKRVTFPCGLFGLGVACV